MPCDLLDPFFDQELTPSEAARFRDHLASCERCAAILLGRMQEQVSVQKGLYPSHVRIEDRITLTCCGKPCKLVGNLSLRGAAGAPNTRLAYECRSCRQHLQVVDEWDTPSAETLGSYDTAP